MFTVLALRGTIPHPIIKNLGCALRPCGNQVLVLLQAGQQVVLSLRRRYQLISWS